MSIKEDGVVAKTDERPHREWSGPYVLCSVELRIDLFTADAAELAWVLIGREIGVR